jgi:protein subunit release factor A
METVIMEVRAAEGGRDAELLVADYGRILAKYATSHCL